MTCLYLMKPEESLAVSIHKLVLTSDLKKDGDNIFVEIQSLALLLLSGEDNSYLPSILICDCSNFSMTLII